MKFDIPCETFLRLSHAAAVGDVEQSLNSVRLENIEGRAYAIASNRKIMAVEFLGFNTEENGAINIAVHSALLEACETWSMKNSAAAVLIEHWPAFNVSSMTVNSHTFYMPFLQPDTFDGLKNWPRQFPSALPKVDKGFVWFETEQLNKLGLSSPSGMIALPEVLDNTGRIIVRDIHDPNWIGVFLPFHPDQPNVKPATLPEWLP